MSKAKRPASTPSVVDKLERILQMLCPPLSKNWLPKRMSQIFKTITREWSADPWIGEYTFESGLCSDKSPIELSIPISRRQDSLLRFVTQTHDSSGSARDNLCLAKSRSLTLARDLTNEASVRILDDLLRDYPDREGEIPKGNFFIWVGCEAMASQSLNLKFYVNPWFSQNHRGVPAILRALKACSLGSECLGELTRVVDIVGESLPQIIGLDFDQRGLTSLKTYFVSNRMTRAKFDGLLRTFGTPRQYEHWSWIDSVLGLRTSNLDNRQVVVSVRFSPGQPTPNVKPYLFCPHFFASDHDVMDFVHRINRQYGSSLPQVKQLEHAVFADEPNENRVDLFNHIGIGQSRMDVYFRPW